MISVIHNLYRRNKFVNESVRLNLMALENSKVPYQYICFNDKGDIDIYEDVKEFEGKIEYIYSEKNFGQKKCGGGWVGALPYVKGDYINSTGQDDVLTEQFYKQSYEILEENPQIYLVFSNCFITDEKLNTTSFGMNPNFNLPYDSCPFECFKIWFGIEENGPVTRANNNFMAPGVIYRKSLHEKIGLPDVEKFEGACDFEYWSRFLFNEYKCRYIPLPNWLYRKSEYSAGNEIIDGKPNRGYWQQMAIEKIKQKYSDLWELKNK